MELKKKQPEIVETTYGYKCDHCGKVLMVDDPRDDIEKYDWMYVRVQENKEEYMDAEWKEICSFDCFLALCRGYCKEDKKPAIIGDMPISMILEMLDRNDLLDDYDRERRPNLSIQ